MMLVGPTILPTLSLAAQSSPPASLPGPQPQQTGPEWLFLLAVALALVAGYLFGKNRKRRRRGP